MNHSSQGNYKVDLIFSKTRLAPIQITIPRLELLGVLIGVRALKFVEKELHLPVNSKVLWTDSQCVLHWKQTAKPLPVFIANRIKASQGTCSEHNPADIATRGQSPSELSTSIWYKGPQWLQQDKKHWPEWGMPETHLSLREFNTECELKLIAGESREHNTYYYYKSRRY